MALVRALEPAGHGPQTVPWAPSSPVGLRLSDLEGPQGEGQDLPLLSLPDGQHPTGSWLNASLMGPH